MKNRLTETKLNSGLGRVCHLTNSVLCLGAVILIASSAQAQNLFMSDGGSGGSRNLGNIYKIDPNGVPRHFASRLNGPLGLAFDSAGNLFLAEYGSGSILKFTPDGGRTTFALGLTGPLGLAFDSAGNLFVADGGSILKFTPDGVRTTFASGLNFPNGLAFDSGGNLFVGELIVSGDGQVQSGNIYKFSTSGVRTTFASGFGPFDLAFDSAGNLFVTAWDSSSGDHVYKFTPSGARSTFAAQLGAPEGLAFDSAGNLFVADEDSGNIYKFTPNGARSTFAALVIGMDSTTFLAFQPGQTSTPPPPNTVAVPSISPDGGRIGRRAMVTLTDATPGASIYYTLDGSDPTTIFATLYINPIKLTRSTTVKAIAIDSNFFNQSGIATARFTIKRR